MIPTQEQLSGGTMFVSQNRRPRKSKPVSLSNWTQSQSLRQWSDLVSHRNYALPLVTLHKKGSKCLTFCAGEPFFVQPPG